MERFLWVCLGGALGSGGRFLVAQWALERFGARFAFGTFAVNATGSFLMAFVMQLSLTTAWIPPITRLALTMGVLGGFTTYSAFNQETLEYAQQGAYALVCANVLGTVAACLAAGLAGHGLARMLAT